MIEHHRLGGSGTGLALHRDERPSKHTLRSLIHITAASEPMRLKLAPTLLQGRGHN
jgi:hypothetical protein